ncbi:MAG: HAD family hydrolase [Campylobacterales bacterium]
MFNFTEKKIFVFDWDGTIFDSMEIKRNTFTDSLYEVIKYIENISMDKCVIYSIYVELSGLPRKEIFREVLKRANIEFSDIAYELFNQKLTEENKKKLVNANVFEDAIVFMKNAILGNKNIYISSSVPQLELDFLTQKRLQYEVISNIKSIFGSSDSFKKGGGHLKSILDAEKCTKRDVIFFGDDYMDFALSRQYGVDCIVIDRNESISSDIVKVKSFSEL